MKKVLMVALIIFVVFGALLVFVGAPAVKALTIKGGDGSANVCREVCIVQISGGCTGYGIECTAK